MYLEDIFRIFTHLQTKKIATLVPSGTRRPCCGQQPSELEILLASSAFSPLLFWLTHVIRKVQTSCPGL